MRINQVYSDSKLRAFELETGEGRFLFPYSRLEICPSADDPVVQVFVDGEIGDEGFTYRLRSGLEDTIHIDQVLEYNQEPGYMRELDEYRKRVKKALGTSTGTRH